MSEKPVSERLQVKHARRLAVVNAPRAVDVAIGAKAARAGIEDADVVVLFVADRAGFDRELPILLKRLRPASILWLAYPKLTSRLAGDLSRDVIHEAVSAHGLTTVSQIAIDEDWSATRFKFVR